MPPATHVVSGQVRDQAFWPESAGTVSLSVTPSTGSVQVQATGGRPHVRVHNAGSVIAFLELGDSTVTAALATGMPIPAGAVEIIGGSFTHAAAITASGTATLYLTPGEGL